MSSPEEIHIHQEVARYGRLENQSISKLLRALSGLLTSDEAEVPPEILLIADSTPRAFVYGSHYIVISQKLFCIANSIDALFFILAHERAHQKFHWSPSGISEHSVEQRELEADAFASNLMDQYAMNKHGAIALLHNPQIVSWSNKSLQYPLLSDRIAMLRQSENNVLPRTEIKPWTPLNEQFNQVIRHVCESAPN